MGKFQSSAHACADISERDDIVLLHAVFSTFSGPCAGERKLKAPRNQSGVWPVARSQAKAENIATLNAMNTAINAHVVRSNDLSRVMKDHS
jgi:hypothetical protein